MTHDIRHILAVQAHLPDPQYIMHGTVQLYARLNALERDALLALFSHRLSEGDMPDDLGRWSTNAFVHGATYRGAFELDFEAATA